MQCTVRDEQSRCERPAVHQGLGFCGSHLRRYRKNGNPGPVGFAYVRLNGVCAGPECMRRPVAHDLCSTHLTQKNRGKVLSVIRVGAQSMRDRALGQLYDGMTESLYEEMLSKQGGVCAICSEPPPEGKHLKVDHDHSCCPSFVNGKRSKSCGKCVRALLCHSCNLGLGQFRDRKDLLVKAIGYLDARTGK